MSDLTVFKRSVSSRGDRRVRRRDPADLRLDRVCAPHPQPGRGPARAVVEGGGHGGALAAVPVLQRFLRSHPRQRQPRTGRAPPPGGGRGLAHPRRALRSRSGARPREPRHHHVAVPVPGGGAHLAAALQPGHRCDGPRGARPHRRHGAPRPGPSPGKSRRSTTSATGSSASWTTSPTSWRPGSAGPGASGPRPTSPGSWRSTRSTGSSSAWATGAAGLPVQELLHAKLSGVRVEDATATYERLTGKVLVDSLRPELADLLGRLPRVAVDSRGQARIRPPAGLSRAWWSAPP